MVGCLAIASVSLYFCVYYPRLKNRDTDAVFIYFLPQSNYRHRCPLALSYSPMRAPSAKSAIAVASPIPDEAPVTIATLESSLPAINNPLKIGNK